jgi:hypothetical protein
MLKKKKAHVLLATTPEIREDALKVIHEIYIKEKNWVQSVDEVFPEEDLTNSDLAWFVVYSEDKPAGILRIMYNLPVHLYKQYDFKLTVKGFDVETFLQHNKIAEIGRFAIIRRYQRRISVLSALMNAAAEHTLNRGYNHYVTDVFEGEINSPLNFHIRVLGFKPVATHDTGEINCANRRVTLILNIKDALERHERKNSRLWRDIGRRLSLTKGIQTA